MTLNTSLNHNEDGFSAGNTYQIYEQIQFHKIIK